MTLLIVLNVESKEEAYPYGVRSRARGGGAPDNNSFDPTADWMPLIIFDCDGGWMPFAAAAQFER